MRVCDNPANSPHITPHSALSPIGLHICGEPLSRESGFLAAEKANKMPISHHLSLVAGVEYDPRRVYKMPYFILVIGYHLIPASERRLQPLTFPPDSS